MSIETLQADLKEIIKQAAPGDSPGVDAVWSFLKDNMLPWMENFVEEVGEMDGAFDALVNASEDVLHTESAQVFVGLIASGAVLIRELETRIGNDQRIMGLIREYKAVSKEATALLEEITLPDPEDDDDDDDDDDDEEKAETKEGPAQ